MTRRHRILLLGLPVVLLLAVGLAVSAVWPVPSKAERKAALIRVRMPLKELNELVFRERCVYPRSLAWNDIHVVRPQDDGSRSDVKLGPFDEGWPVLSFQTTPPPPVHPLTRLRRTLAHVFPFVDE
jgi:hypothetical protein